MALAARVLEALSEAEYEEQPEIKRALAEGLAKGSALERAKAK